ncbi:5-formyltetrahydrofolate cyclo-ligase [Forsythia ovata]|uniref:5-formyltetrahydrofolate cyclo-ligase n=1 Tax=Forsythia ovata TaxID=205694 RepID=A0ABD1QA41_9LAMI
MSPKFLILVFLYALYTADARGLSSKTGSPEEKKAIGRPADLGDDGDENGGAFAGIGNKGGIGAGAGGGGGFGGGIDIGIGRGLDIGGGFGGGAGGGIGGRLGIGGGPGGGLQAGDPMEIWNYRSTEAFSDYPVQFCELLTFVLRFTACGPIFSVPDPLFQFAVEGIIATGKEARYYSHVDDVQNDNTGKYDHSQVSKKLYVPWVEDKNSHMRMLNTSRMNDLIANSMDKLEPAPVDVERNKRKDGNSRPFPLKAWRKIVAVQTLRQSMKLKKLRTQSAYPEANDQLRRWFADDDALERALHVEWVSKTHARISYKYGAFFVTDLRSEHGTWITE